MVPRHYIRNAWYAAGLSEEFAVDELQGHAIAGRPVLLWRSRDGAVGAYDNRCAHKRMPLSEGRVLDDGSLECAYHGLCYVPGGDCVAVPSHPDGPIPKQAKLRPFPVIEQDGVVWVWPGDPDRQHDSRPPPTPEITADAWDSVSSGPMQVPANYLLLIENLLDISHFYPLHDGNIGDKANSRIPVKMVEGEVDGNRFVKTIREVENYTQPPFLADWFGYDVVDRHHTHCMVSPGLTRVEMRVAPPGQLGTEAERGYVLLHTHTPEDGTSHVWRWCVNFTGGLMSRSEPDVPSVERFAEMFPAVAAEDRWALEKQQQMFDFPDEGYTEVFLRPDKALRRARQVFSALLRKEREPALEQAPKAAAGAS